ncbi:Hypothetical predicted protein [Olea europaea subsp. europaea]|uniref:Uncharacterized protein n=1 Tax=Olea europaea subsp. europaea TaxID=158383 RepID=A0A8S0V012_OLEEU|nr:Hypothetical predicted protein [Olea europaea subsp. europaea]
MAHRLEHIRTIAAASPTPPPPTPKPNFSKATFATTTSIKMMQRCRNSNLDSNVGAATNDVGCTASSRSIAVLPTMHTHLRQVSCQRKVRSTATVGHRSIL